jgi:hypothetical protein
MIRLGTVTSPSVDRARVMLWAAGEAGDDHGQPLPRADPEEQGDDEEDVVVPGEDVQDALPDEVPQGLAEAGVPSPIERHAQLALGQALVAALLVGDGGVGELGPLAGVALVHAGRRQRRQIDVGLDVVAGEEAALQALPVLEIPDHLVGDGHVVGHQRADGQLRQIVRAGELGDGDDPLGGVVPEEAPQLLRVAAGDAVVADEEALEQVRREEAAVVGQGLGRELEVSVALEERQHRGLVQREHEGDAAAAGGRLVLAVDGEGGRVGPRRRRPQAEGQHDDGAQTPPPDPGGRQVPHGRQPTGRAPRWPRRAGSAA